MATMSTPVVTKNTKEKSALLLKSNSKIPNQLNGGPGRAGIILPSTPNKMAMAPSMIKRISIRLTISDYANYAVPPKGTVRA
jgi:hypothetical protein